MAFCMHSTPSPSPTGGGICYIADDGGLLNDPPYPTVWPGDGGLPIKRKENAGELYKRGA